MEASLEHLTFKPRKTPESMDWSSIYTYDSYSGHPSPRLGSMPIAADYPSYASGGSYVATPARPYTPSSGDYTAALANLSPGKLSSDGMQSRRCSHGTICLPSPPLLYNVRYNPIAQLPSRATGDCTRTSKSPDPDNDDDFQPATPPPHKTGPSQHREEIRHQHIEPVSLTAFLAACQYTNGFPEILRIQWPSERITFPHAICSQSWSFQPTSYSSPFSPLFMGQPRAACGSSDFHNANDLASTHGINTLHSLVSGLSTSHAH